MTCAGIRNVSIFVHTVPIWPCLIQFVASISVVQLSGSMHFPCLFMRAPFLARVLHYSSGEGKCLSVSYVCSHTRAVSLKRRSTLKLHVNNSPRAHSLTLNANFKKSSHAVGSPPTSMRASASSSSLLSSSSPAGGGGVKANVPRRPPILRTTSSEPFSCSLPNVAVLASPNQRPSMPTATAVAAEEIPPPPPISLAGVVSTSSAAERKPVACRIKSPRSDGRENFLEFLSE